MLRLLLPSRPPSPVPLPFLLLLLALLAVAEAWEQKWTEEEPRTTSRNSTGSKDGVQLMEFAPKATEETFSRDLGTTGELKAKISVISPRDDKRTLVKNMVGNRLASSLASY
jgi:hypothetical protein